MNRKVILCLLISLVLFAGWAENSTEWTGEPTITVSYRSTEQVKGDVIIPSCINGATVTGIGAFAVGQLYQYFDSSINQYTYSEITSISIPDSVMSIGYAAFSDCTGLTEVVFPGFKKNILSQNEGVVGDYAFSNCISLASINLGAVKSIGKNAFSNCSSLKSVSWDSWGPDFIGDYAFAACTALEKISNINCDIGEYTFQDCTALKSIWAFSDIGDYAFSGCTALESITVCGDIGRFAFENCAGLKSIARGFSGGKVFYDIDEFAFMGCVGLTEVDFYFTRLGIFAFYGCSGLKKITISQNTSDIGDGAFGGCINLTDIIVEEANYKFSAENGMLFDKGKTTLLAYPSASGSVGIPDSVATIGPCAFFGCSGLTSVTIPSSVVNIGYEAFAYCTSLSKITIPNSVRWIGDYAFEGCTSLTLIVFAGTKAQWTAICSENSLSGSSVKFIRCSDGSIIL